MPDDATNNTEKILESLFEPNNAEILTQLKDEPKSLSDLMKKTNLSKEKLDEKLSYLIENGFVSKTEKNNDIFYTIDAEKISSILENDDNFKNKLIFFCLMYKYSGNLVASSYEDSNNFFTNDLISIGVIIRNV